ncbi:hypothetical protein [Nocardia sp. R6R-6]|uniref:hypothetical protein n=1 Tax=Nocardia sp. R6R-6 TaxID=3459303 RepID=UPI00403D6ADC
MTSNFDSLQDFIDKTPNLVDFLYNDTRPVHSSRAGRGGGRSPIPSAFSNWRDEQDAASETAVLLHQSHNMPGLFLEGPGAFDLLRSVAVNTFEKFALDRAKQFIACTPSGHLIGDCILYRHGKESFELVSGAPVLNWVSYQAGIGDFDVEILRDDASNINPSGRRIRYRFELAGLNAREIFDSIVEGGAPEVPFFRTRQVRINGRDVLALRHGMTGSFAVELSGPFEEETDVRSFILSAGQDFGLEPMGMDAYYSNIHSGWIPYPVPAIFTDPALADYRRHLPASTFEVHTELGGSFQTDDLSDYYATPYDFGYQNVIKFDHDFHGREALLKIADESKREKVTLVWNQDDVQRIVKSQFGSGPRYKSIDFPNVTYAWNQFDEVRSAAGEFIGVSRHAAYQRPLGDVISLALLGRGQATLGSEVTLTWGEPGGGSRKPQVERHEQTTIRARVAPAPYAPETQRLTRQVSAS